MSDLPDFKFDLEEAKGWSGAAGSARQHTVDEFPVSTSFAAVSMRLQPGALRELHWHAIAAEWAYVIAGRCRVTVIAPSGDAEISDFGPGDVWYFPKGHGHSIQGLGPGECHFLLIFDDGRFSEFGTFSITDWMAHTPPDVLAANLNLPPQALAKLPKKEVYIVQGELPPPAPPGALNRALQPSQRNHKFRLGAAPLMSFAGGTERLVSRQQFPISSTITGVLLTLEPGGLRELHWHPNADEWQYYISGRSEIGIFGANGKYRQDEFGPGQVAFINRGFGHYIRQIGSEETQILVAFNSPDYQEISISSWLASNPPQLLADNFGLDPTVIGGLPQAGRFIVAT
ncbi:MAG: cupin domain-containing protein [Candidatus Eremiobacteraeota bacterium]|nr:cupin domain-containing protein [Candidatus Eremiobacteraeota bacterium]MBV9700620.1 cupin domain-containing protein [Candidatus Eremiobacteraeota bacterium]